MTPLFRFFRKSAEAGQSGTATDTWTGKVKKDTALTGCPFAVFDTELSGLDPRKDFIVSIGAVKMTGKIIHINTEFNRFIRPSGEMTRKSIEVHGILPGELESEDAFDRVLPEFLTYMTDYVLVGHFVHIDLRFLKTEMRRRSLKALSNPALDTHTIHQWLLENSRSFRKHYRGGSNKTDLFSVARGYGVPVETLHDAAGDAFITAQLFQKFLHFLEEEGISTLGELIDIGRA